MRTPNDLGTAGPRTPVMWALVGLLALGACGGGGGGGGGAAPETTASLSVAVVGPGSVASTPAGIACSGDCGEAYALGTVVLLLPRPAVAAVFAGWSGDADCSDGSVTMSADRHCTATFAALPAGAGSRVMGGLDVSLARGRNGSVASWGSDASEALGNGVASAGRSVPGPISLVATIDSIATAPGALHSLVIEHTTGRVLGWGNNAAGQLGDGSQTTRSDAVAMHDATGAELGGAVAVAVGSAHSLVLRGDGAVLAAGLNSSGQLGDGSAQSRDFAAPVSQVCGAGNVVTAIAAGDDFSLALCADGSLRAWGGNAVGQLGNGSSAASAGPVMVVGLSGHVVKAIAAGAAFALALDADGFVWSWGSNARGQLGTDSTVVTQRSVPGLVGGFVGATAVAAGLEHGVAVLANNAVFAWGANDSGQVSPALAGISQVDFSIHVDGLPAIVEVAAGRGHSLAVDSAGRVWTWGDNAAGELGNGSLAPSSAPAMLAGLNLN